MAAKKLSERLSKLKKRIWTTKKQTKPIKLRRKKEGKEGRRQGRSQEEISDKKKFSAYSFTILFFVGYYYCFLF